MNDLISREAAIDAVRTYYDDEYALADSIEELIEKLPSAQPERKKGKWIEEDDGWDGVYWRCSECDGAFCLVDGTPKENEYNFCPNCGADMRGEDDE